MTTLAADPALIAAAVTRALREELETYPKPGLVSYVDRGSHPDMDSECFLASIAALEPFFAQMAGAGAAGCALRDLQNIGLKAESAMLAATNGRNTHRGAIFCLGLLAAAAGARTTSQPLGEIVRQRWGGEIPQAADLPETSAGIALCHRHHLGGVRREAALGFPSVYRHGLPAFRSTNDRSAARVQAFFALLETCEDTTLLKRGGPEGREFAQAEARRFREQGGVANPRWRETATEIHHAFIRRNLTAGGAADLLAATLFVNDLSPALPESVFISVH
jgi:triphosphoribosyl-dephospho-CoA synthase